MHEVSHTELNVETSLNGSVVTPGWKFEKGEAHQVEVWIKRLETSYQVTFEIKEGWLNRSCFQTISKIQCRMCPRKSISNFPWKTNIGSTLENQYQICPRKLISNCPRKVISILPWKIIIKFALEKAYRICPGKSKSKSSQVERALNVLTSVKLFVIRNMKQKKLVPKFKRIFKTQSNFREPIQGLRNHSE